MLSQHISWSDSSQSFHVKLVIEQVHLPSFNILNAKTDAVIDRQAAISQKEIQTYICIEC